jgi:hypothetical protein
VGNLHDDAAADFMNSSGHLLESRDMIIILDTVHIRESLAALQNIGVTGYDQSDIIPRQRPDQINALLTDEAVDIAQRIIGGGS